MLRPRRDGQIRARQLADDSVSARTIAPIKSGEIEIAEDASLVVADSPVALNQTGFFVDGVQLPVFAIATVRTSSNNAGNLTATKQNLTTATFDVPDWANFAHIIVHARCQLSTGSTARVLGVAVNINDPDAPASGSQTAPANSQTRNYVTSMWTLERDVDFTSEITARGWYSIDAGSESSHNERLRAMCWFTR